MNTTTTILADGFLEYYICKFYKYEYEQIPVIGFQCAGFGAAIRVELLAVVEATRVRWRAKSEDSVRTSLYHPQYLTLDLYLGDRLLLKDSISFSIISWVIKARV